MEKERVRIAREIIQKQNIGAVLLENGISETEFIRWLEEGEAAEYLYRMARVKAMAKVSEIWLKLEQMAAEGDLKAMKLYCDLCEKEQKDDGTVSAVGNSDVEAARMAVFGCESEATAAGGLHEPQDGE